MVPSLFCSLPAEAGVWTQETNYQKQNVNYTPDQDQSSPLHETITITSTDQRARVWIIKDTRKDHIPVGEG